MVQRSDVVGQPNPTLEPFAAFLEARVQTSVETTLVELVDGCLRLRGPLALRGATLDEIEELDAISGGVRLRVRDTVMELRGCGAACLGMLLASALPGRFPTIPGIDLEAGERVLAGGPAQLGKDGVLEGVVVLSSSRLRSFIWPPDPFATGPQAAHLELRRGTIVRCWSDGGPETVHVDGGAGHVHTFVGPAAALIHLGLTGPAVPLLALVATRVLGLVGVPGLLMLGDRELVHIPTGALDKLPGVGPVRVALPDVAEVTAAGASDGGMVTVASPAGRMRFRVPVMRVFASLLRERMEQDLEGAVVVRKPTAPPPKVDADAEEGEPAEVAAPVDLAVSGACLTVARGQWRFGTLVLRQHAVLFQPRPGAESGVIRIPVSVVTRTRAGPQSLLLRSADRRLPFFVADVAFVDRYWADARTPDRIYTPKDQNSRIMRRISGVQRMVKVWAGDDLYLSELEVPVRLGELGELGVSLRLPGRFQDAPEPGTIIRVEVFHADGIFEFTSRLEARQVGTPDPSRGEVGARHALVLDMPTTVRGFDKRQDRRLQVYAPMRIARKNVPEGGRQLLLGLTHNISPGGCALQTRTPLEVGEDLAFVVMLEDELLEFEGEVIRKASDHGLWGIRFTEVSGISLTRLLRYAREQEREALALARDRNEDTLL